MKFGYTQLAAGLLLIVAKPSFGFNTHYHVGVRVHPHIRTASSFPKPSVGSRTTRLVSQTADAGGPEKKGFLQKVCSKRTRVAFHAARGQPFVFRQR